MNPIILMVLAAAGYMMFAGAAKVTAATSLDYQVRTLQVHKITLTTLSLKVVFGVINKSTEQLMFTSFVGELLNSTGTEKVADINVASPISIYIEPNTTTNIPVAFAVKNTTILSQLIDLVKSKKKPKSYLIKGILKLGPISLPVNKLIPLTT